MEQRHHSDVHKRTHRVLEPPGAQPAAGTPGLPSTPPRAHPPEPPGTPGHGILVCAWLLQ